jgi:hypothetical protein
MPNPANLELSQEAEFVSELSSLAEEPYFFTPVFSNRATRFSISPIQTGFLR